jgi:hypothetical protein
LFEEDQGYKCSYKDGIVTIDYNLLAAVRFWLGKEGPVFLEEVTGAISKATDDDKYCGCTEWTIKDGDDVEATLSALREMGYDGKVKDKMLYVRKTTLLERALSKPPAKQGWSYWKVERGDDVEATLSALREKGYAARIDHGTLCVTVDATAYDGVPTLTDVFGADDDPVAVLKFRIAMVVQKKGFDREVGTTVDPLYACDEETVDKVVKAYAAKGWLTARYKTTVLISAPTKPRAKREKTLMDIAAKVVVESWGDPFKFSFLYEDDDLEVAAQQVALLGCTVRKLGEHYVVVERKEQ